MTLDTEKEVFIQVAKLILKEKLSTNPEKLKEYRNKIISAFNRFVLYCAKRYEEVDDRNKAILEYNYYYIRGKFEACLRKLKCIHEIENRLFAPAIENRISQPGTENAEEGKESFQSIEESDKSDNSDTQKNQSIWRLKYQNF